MADNFWAITTFFNPMHWRRRLANYRLFRRRLSIPLVTVELGYGGQFELTASDADLLVQIPGADVMWQKERLFNIALQALPPHVDRVACLDGDVVFDRHDVWRAANRALDRSPIVQLFSHVYYLPPDQRLDLELIKLSRTSGPGFGWLREQGYSPLELCNPTWSNPGDYPPVSYGLGWAFRRELLAERGFFDPWIVGGGTRVHFFAAHGLWQEAAKAFRFGPAIADQFRHWTEGLHADVRGDWGYVPGAVMHLWHGSAARRKHRQRYEEFAQFDFDPTSDLALDDFGAWRWNSHKPQMHEYLRDYFAGRREDDLTTELSEKLSAAA